LFYTPFYVTMNLDKSLDKEEAYIEIYIPRNVKQLNRRLK